MALDLNTVNTAYLAFLGRPAEGRAYEWASTFASNNELMDAIVLAQIPQDADFIESLYENNLSHPSDKQGYAFWNEVYAAQGKEATYKLFKATIIQIGAADASNADYQGFMYKNKEWVKKLYTKLLGDENPDDEGVEFWTKALASSLSQGDVVTAFKKQY